MWPVGSFGRQLVACTSGIPAAALFWAMKHECPTQNAGDGPAKGPRCLDRAVRAHRGGSHGLHMLLLSPATQTAVSHQGGQQLLDDERGVVEVVAFVYLRSGGCSLSEDRTEAQIAECSCSLLERAVVI